MKRIIAFLLIVSMICVYCGITAFASETETIEIFEWDESITDMNDPALLEYVEGAVYSYLDAEFSDGTYVIEEVNAVFVSKEYLEEVSYNSEANVFFGYTLADIDATFTGTRYVFTCSDEETVVQQFNEIPDDTFEQVFRNVAIGTGIIIICVVICVATAGIGSTPTAAGVGALSTGTKISMVFAASAKSATAFAVGGATIGGATTAIIKGIETGDFYEAMSAAALTASENFKWGAVTGSVTGGISELIRIENTYFFKQGTPQAIKYPNGIKTRKGPDGLLYPDFDEYAIATAKFDMPTPEGVKNNTTLRGEYYWDAKMANQQCGYVVTPPGYVWHHVEDMQTMQLIPKEIHNVAMGGVKHKGGASLIREFLGIE